MLRKEEILEKTSNGLNVFRHYIPCQWRVGRNFFNPLYEDKKASCNIYFDRKAGTYKLKDFGNDEYSGDCFYFVSKLKGLNCNNASDFVEILKMINQDLSLGLLENVERSVPFIPEPPISAIPENKSKPYSFMEQKFTRNELEYWQQYGITTEMLKAYKVCSIKEFKSENNEGKSYSIVSSALEPTFGYKSKRYIKLYRPFSKIRFLYGGDIGEKYCFGLEQLPAKGDTVFITGGEKDVLSLAIHGFHAICFNSETVSVPTEIIHKLTFRFKHIVLLYDMDKTGLESSAKYEKQLSEHGVKRLLLPLPGTKEEKDISDYFRLGNVRESFLKLFLDLLDTLYSDTMTMLKSCEIDFNNPPAKAQEIISAGDVPLGTQGNILCITGGEGTGKSNYVAALVAGSIRPENSQVDTLGINVYQNTQNKAVLLYDV